jgi:uncharacterized membrane protein
MFKLACGFAVLALALAACTPADAELDGDLEVNGMEPAFWGVKVTRADNTTSIAVLGERDIAGGLPVKSSGENNSTVLTSTTPEGDFVMTLKKEDCKDGLGEREYHWSVLASWKGETLKGCAAPMTPAVKPAS